MPCLWKLYGLLRRAGEAARRPPLFLGLCLCLLVPLLWLPERPPLLRKRPAKAGSNNGRPIMEVSRQHRY